MLATLPWLSTVVAALVVQVYSCEDLPSPNHHNVESFAGRHYDYLIIGGGTAGMLVASRLAQRTPLQIGVIEAGSFRHNDPNVDIPSRYTLLSGPSYDWGFESIPQTHAGLRNITVARGKMLGGSSGKNLMAFNRGSSAEYDAFSLFAQAQNWTWDGLLPHFRSTERTSPLDPFASFSQGSTNMIPEFSGYHGPISGSLNEMYSAEIPDYVRTLNRLGVNTNLEADNGNAIGLYNTRLSVDRVKGVRSYAATEFYCNQPQQPNLHILTGAQVTRIQFRKGKSKPVATGAEFFVPELKSHFKASATKEVILAAGTIQTPQLLELSGIGNSSLLKNLHIPVLVDNPAVGENLQDHAFFPLQFELADNVTSFDTLRKNETFMAEQQKLYNATRSGLVAATDSTIVYIPLQSVTNQTRVGELLNLVETELGSTDQQSLTAIQYGLQRDWIKAGNVSFIEIIALSAGLVNPQPDKSYMTILGGLMHPMSRGSVHIHTTNPLTPPTIDVGYFTSDFDVEVLLDALKFAQRIGSEPPFSSIVTAMTPPVGDDDALRDFIRNASSSGSHFIGTAAVGPIEKGGVVDASLRVYGTMNLRIIDASVLPNQVAAHTQATVYAVAEAAIDRIIRDL